MNKSQAGFLLAVLALGLTWPSLARWDSPATAKLEGEDAFDLVQAFVLKLDNADATTPIVAAACNQSSYQAGLSIFWTSSQTCDPNEAAVKELSDKIAQALSLAARPEEAAAASVFVSDTGESARQYLEGVKTRTLKAIQDALLPSAQKIELERRVSELGGRISLVSQRYEEVARKSQIKELAQEARALLLSAAGKIQHTPADLSAANQDYHSALAKLHEAAESIRVSGSLFERTKEMTQALIGGFEIVQNEANSGLASSETALRQIASNPETAN